MIKEKIILIGGGGHCKSCIDVIEQEGKFIIAGIVDIPEKIGQKILDYEIIASDNDLDYLSKNFKYFFITVGQIFSVQTRIKLYNKIRSLSVVIPSIQSPYSYVSKHSIISEGSIIMHYASVNVNSRIGKNCIINTKALIEHDTIIGDFCHISTGAIVNGGVKIGNHSFLGSGSVTKDNIEIVANSFIKANSLIK
jgi:sugar O-acyltransferase (sialic acid O-acetyltransferase NeuD family)